MGTGEHHHPRSHGRSPPRWRTVRAYGQAVCLSSLGYWLYSVRVLPVSCALEPARVSVDEQWTLFSQKWKTQRRGMGGCNAH